MGLHLLVFIFSLGLYKKNVNDQMFLIITAVTATSRKTKALNVKRSLQMKN